MRYQIPTAKRILVLGQQRRFVAEICKYLSALGHDFIGTTSSEEAIAFLDCPEAMPIDLLLTDIDTCEGSYLEVINTVRTRWLDFPVLGISNKRQPALRTMRLLNFRLLPRPVDPENLDRALLDLLSPPMAMAS